MKIPTLFTAAPPWLQGMESHWKPPAFLGAQSAPTHTHAGWRQEFISCSSEAEKFRIKEQVPSVSGECPFPESWMASFPGRRARTAPREEPWSPPKAPLGPFPRLHLPARSLRGWALGGRACISSLDSKFPCPHIQGCPRDIRWQGTPVPLQTAWVQHPALAPDPSFLLMQTQGVSSCPLPVVSA